MNKLLAALPILLLLGLAAPAHAFMLVAHTYSTCGAGTCTTPAINTTGANLLVASISDYCTMMSVSNMSDSNGNTWLLAAGSPTSGGLCTALFYAASPTVSASQTFTITNQQYPAFTVAAYSGAASSPLDATSSAGSSSGTSLQPGSIMPSQSNELLVTSLVLGTTNTPTVNDSFSITDFKQEVGGVNWGGGMAYLVQSTATAINPTWTWTASASAGSVIASFKGGGSTQLSQAAVFSILGGFFRIIGGMLTIR